MATPNDLINIAEARLDDLNQEIERILEELGHYHKGGGDGKDLCEVLDIIHMEGYFLNRGKDGEDYRKRRMRQRLLGEYYDGDEDDQHDDEFEEDERSDNEAEELIEFDPERPPFWLNHKTGKREILWDMVPKELHHQYQDYFLEDRP